MPSTIKLQDATNNSMDALFKTMNTNTAKESVNPASTVVTEKIPNAAAKPKVSARVSESETQTVTTAPEKKTEIKDDDLTKVGVCFNVPRYIRDMWKTYFTTHGLTMTDGLIQAVNYLKEQEEQGAVKLGAISVIKNQ